MTEPLTVVELCKRFDLDEKATRGKLRKAIKRGILKHPPNDRWIATREVLAVLGIDPAAVERGWP